MMAIYAISAGSEDLRGSMFLVESRTWKEHFLVA
jgi:hypothetical protein